MFEQFPDKIYDLLTKNVYFLCGRYYTYDSTLTKEASNFLW